MESLFQKGLLPADLIGKMTFFPPLWKALLELKIHVSFFLLISADVLSFQANHMNGYIVLLGNYVHYF